MFNTKPYARGQRTILSVDAVYGDDLDLLVLIFDCVVDLRSDDGLRLAFLFVTDDNLPSGNCVKGSEKDQGYESVRASF